MKTWNHRTQRNNTLYYQCAKCSFLTKFHSSCSVVIIVLVGVRARIISVSSVV
jgi:hypothetical protein